MLNISADFHPPPSRPTLVITWGLGVLHAIRHKQQQGSIPSDEEQVKEKEREPWPWHPMAEAISWLLSISIGQINIESSFGRKEEERKEGEFVRLFSLQRMKLQLRGCWLF